MQARSEAEVELVLDNSDGAARRAGERDRDHAHASTAPARASYRINGARCRLVDVLELLSDTGLGKETHSVISQGRVEAIVTSKPRDRRLLIEEAAGLGKHRKRRRRAQLKLERTAENLDRALDVEREARSRLRPLKRQAEAAELHERLERQMLEARWTLAREELRARRGAPRGGAERGAAGARAARDAVQGELAQVAERRAQAELALAQRSERHEQLATRAFAAALGPRPHRSCASSGRATLAATLAERAQRRERELAALVARAGFGAEAGGAERIAALEAELAMLERERETRLRAGAARARAGSRSGERRRAGELELARGRAARAARGGGRAG